MDQPTGNRLSYHEFAFALELTTYYAYVTLTTNATQMERFIFSSEIGKHVDNMLGNPMLCYQPTWLRLYAECKCDCDCDCECDCDLSSTCLVPFAAVAFGQKTNGCFMAKPSTTNYAGPSTTHTHTERE